jgi:hypothetical protein
MEVCEDQCPIMFLRIEVDVVDLLFIRRRRKNRISRFNSFILQRGRGRRRPFVARGQGIVNVVDGDKEFRCSYPAFECVSDTLSLSLSLVSSIFSILGEETGYLLVLVCAVGTWVRT